MFRFRFRLITLFAMMSVIAVGAAAYGVYRKTVLAEEMAILAEVKALNKISNKGAWIIKSTGGGVTVEFFAQQPASPPMLMCGTGVERVYSPIGNGIDFTDKDLALFEDVREVNFVNFKGSSVSALAQKQFAIKHPRCRFED